MSKAKDMHRTARDDLRESADLLKKSIVSIKEIIKQVPLTGTNFAVTQSALSLAREAYKYTLSAASYMGDRYNEEIDNDPAWKRYLKEMRSEQQEYENEP